MWSAALRLSPSGTHLNAPFYIFFGFPRLAAAGSFPESRISYKLPSSTFRLSSVSNSRCLLIRVLPMTRRGRPSLRQLCWALLLVAPPSATVVDAAPESLKLPQCHSTHLSSSRTCVKEKRAAPRKQCALKRSPRCGPPLNDCLRPAAAGTSCALMTSQTRLNVETFYVLQSPQEQQSGAGGGQFVDVNTLTGSIAQDILIKETMMLPLETTDQAMARQYRSLRLTSTLWVQQQFSLSRTPCLPTKTLRSPLGQHTDQVTITRHPSLQCFSRALDFHYTKGYAQNHVLLSCYV